MPPPKVKKLDEDGLAEVLDLIEELFGINTLEDEDPLIDLPMIGVLAGVSENTPGQWQNRTRQGRMKEGPFPDPDDTRYGDKPQWKAVSTIVEGFLIPTGRWPRGSVGRPNTQGPRIDPERAVSFAELCDGYPKLGDKIGDHALNDNVERTVPQWRARLRRHQRAAA